MSNILAIGDVHAKLWIIEEAEKLVDSYDKIIFIGDYADDWDTSPVNSINAWRELKKLQELYPQKVIALTGNHDYSYVNVLDNLSGGYNRLTQLLLDAPENKNLKVWVKSLPISVVEDGVTYSHAGFTEEWMSNVGEKPLWGHLSPLWARPHDDCTYRSIPQVFGHTPSETCWEVIPNVWCIDTFSTWKNKTPIGDETVLEIIDGKEFKPRSLK